MYNIYYICIIVCVLPVSNLKQRLHERDVSRVKYIPGYQCILAPNSSGKIQLVVTTNTGWRFSVHSITRWRDCRLVFRPLCALPWFPGFSSRLSSFFLRWCWHLCRPVPREHSFLLYNWQRQNDPHKTVKSEFFSQACPIDCLYCI